MENMAVSKFVITRSTVSAWMGKFFIMSSSNEICIFKSEVNNQ